MLAKEADAHELVDRFQELDLIARDELCSLVSLYGDQLDSALEVGYDARALSRRTSHGTGFELILLHWSSRYGE